MSKLSDRCEERKNEAQALADKFNAEKAEIDKLRGEANQREKDNAIVYEQFTVKFSICRISCISTRRRGCRNYKRSRRIRLNY